MADERPIWKAEQSHTGGYLCTHDHHTRTGAERCLPKLPHQPRGSLTQTFSLARVVAMNAAAERIDLERDED